MGFRGNRTACIVPVLNTSYKPELAMAMAFKEILVSGIRREKKIVELRIRDRKITIRELGWDKRNFAVLLDFRKKID